MDLRHGMSTFTAQFVKIIMLDSLITSKTRIKLLVKFFVTSANSGHLRGLANEFNESTNAIRKELNHLSEAGYLEKRELGNKVSYKANTRHPMFGLMQEVVRRYLGLDTIVTQIVERMGQVDVIELVGDYALGLDTGCIEVNVVGSAVNSDYLNQLGLKIEEVIDRKVGFKLNEPLSKDGIVLYGNL